MDKTFIKDLHDKDAVDSIFLVSRKSLVTTKGHPFMAIQLRDRTGELDARLWNDLDAAGASFDKGDLVHVRGSMISFQNRPQLKIDLIEKADPAQTNASDFADPPKPAPGDRAVSQIREMAERIQDPSLKALCQAFLRDDGLMDSMRTTSAARSIHHSAPGGLAEHTLSVMKLALRVADHYPMADRDMLIAGAFLHDIGKLRELAMNDRQAEYTDEGRFIGHLVIGAQMVHDKCAALKDFPADLEMQLTHIILAHHGTMEFGSPRLPQTLEAIIVHYVDDLDSKVGALLEICQRDPSANERWTDFQKQYNRYFYKGATPTIHGKFAFESKKRRAMERKAAADKAKTDKVEASPKGERPAKADASAGEAKGQATPKPAEQKPRHDRKDGERRGGPDKGQGGQKGPSLTFKAFGDLMLSLPNAAAEAAKAEDKPVENTAEEDVAAPLQVAEGQPLMEAVEDTVDAALESAAKALSNPES